MKRYKHIIATIAAATALQGCFTGVESTPRIGSNELRRQNVRPTPERLFLSDIAPEPPSQWKAGKRFYVTDNRIGIIFTAASAPADSLESSELVWQRFDPIGNVTGTGATDMVFTDYEGHELHYVVPISTDELSRRERQSVPYTIDRDIVERVDSAMRGNTYYIMTPLWFEAGSRKGRTGLRHVPVRVLGVSPGTAVYPLAVDFVTTDQPVADTARVMMTIGNDPSATRNFYTLFTFSNPRKFYPDITDETWQKIIRGQLVEGMTRDECRLALGAPTEVERIPIQGNLLERWRYDEGIYLIFEDGILTQYRR